MPNKIQLRRGLKSAIPTGASGEPLFATDTRELFIGTGSGNVNMGGSHWYRGTAMSGASATINAYSYSACPQVKLDDMYLNTSNGNIYACTTAGSGSSAKWTYQGCIKGVKGDAGSYFPSSGYANMDELTLDLDDMKNAHLAPPTTITIGCLDSKHQWLCDFIAPSNNDITQILQQAINALPPAGGKISILEGSYDIKGQLTVNRNVVFEGMGDATVLNFTELSNKPAYMDVADDAHIHFNNIKINVVTKPVAGDNIMPNVGACFIKGGNIRLSNSAFTLTSTADVFCCAHAFLDSVLVQIFDSDIEIINNSVTSDYINYSSRMNLICDKTYTGGSTGKTRTLITNCNITCTGKKGTNSGIPTKARAAISASENTQISNCNITLNVLGSVTEDVDSMFGASIIGCYIFDKSTEDCYISMRVISNNIVKMTQDTTYVYLPTKCVITGNAFNNIKSDDIKVYNNGAVVATGNHFNKSCQLTTSSNKVVANNLVY